MKKKCSQCNIEKEFTEFSFHETGKYNLHCHCKKCRNEYFQIYREKNREKRRKYNKEYYSKNTEFCKEINTRFHKKWHKEKYASDNLYKLKCNIRSLILTSLKKKGFTKKTKTHRILGCTFKEFKNHIESQWEEWMDWDNHGSYNGKEKAVCL